jgi:hypothetical protein
VSLNFGYVMDFLRACELQLLVSDKNHSMWVIGDHRNILNIFPHRELRDLYDNRQSITPPSTTVGGYIPSNLVCDYRDYIASSQKISALMGNSSDCLLPGHEPSLLLDTL